MCCPLLDINKCFSSLQTEQSCEDPSLEKKESEVEVGLYGTLRTTLTSPHFSTNAFKWKKNPDPTRRKCGADLNLWRHIFFWGLHVGQWESSCYFRTVFQCGFSQWWQCEKWALLTCSPHLLLHLLLHHIHGFIRTLESLLNMRCAKNTVSSVNQSN